MSSRNIFDTPKREKEEFQHYYKSVGGGEQVGDFSRLLYVICVSVVIIIYRAGERSCNIISLQMNTIPKTVTIHTYNTRGIPVSHVVSCSCRSMYAAIFLQQKQMQGGGGRVIHAGFRY